MRDSPDTQLHQVCALQGYQGGYGGFKRAYGAPIMDDAEFRLGEFREILNSWDANRADLYPVASSSLFEKNLCRTLVVNCTLFARLYDILKTNGVFFYARRDTEQATYGRV